MTDDKPHIALIGLGLIGSSLGHALKKHGLARHISGYARSQETRIKAKHIGFVDSTHDDVQNAVRHADIVFLNVPMGAMGGVAREIAGALKAGAIITDVGSVKLPFIEELTPILPPHVHLVPGHPIAGTEHSGPESGFAELFENRWCILTPQEHTKLHAVNQIANLWKDIGCEIEFMDAAHHDLVLAITSHIPHLIAFNIVGTAADLETKLRREVIKYSASGFRDFTRIAASDPIMWRDVFAKNKEAVLEMLSRFNADMEELQTAIRDDNLDMLEAKFSRTRNIRRAIIEAGQIEH